MTLCTEESNNVAFPIDFRDSPNQTVNDEVIAFAIRGHIVDSAQVWPYRFQLSISIEYLYSPVIAV